jgi:polyhydroxyalkanoate synthesis regulator phasin
MIGLIDSTEKLYAEALATMKKKNADYSGDASGMKNFEIAASVANIKMSQGILTRLTDKVTRIGNLIVKEGAVNEESIFDTVQDLINYAAILHYSLQIERKDATYKIHENTSIDEFGSPR